MKYYSALKRNDLLIDASTWMDLKRIILGGEKKPFSKEKKANYTYFIIPFMSHS